MRKKSPHPRTTSRYSGCGLQVFVVSGGVDERRSYFCSTANDAAILCAIGFSSRFANTLPRFSTYVCSLSFSLVASRGARGCYRDSWQHHGPAFAAWPAIVFLVSLQSTARSILPRSSTATSASFAASYFTGAQHGVARYLGNFAERGCSLCQQPVPRRQRIRRCRAFFSLLSLLLSIQLLSLSSPFSHPFRRTRFFFFSSSTRITRSRERAFSCVGVHRRHSSCPVAASSFLSPQSHPSPSSRRPMCRCFYP